MKHLFVVLPLALMMVSPVNAKPEVLQVAQDTYVITKSSYAGAFANMSKLKASVIKQANEFAESQGKVVVPISQRQRRPDAGFPSYEFQFRVVSPDDPEAVRTALASGPDAVVQGRHDVNIDVTKSGREKDGDDFYSSLIKLDDLRTKGLITDEEFEAQKQRLLAAD